MLNDPDSGPSGIVEGGTTEDIEREVKRARLCPTGINYVQITRYRSSLDRKTLAICRGFRSYH